ncbi:protein ECT2 isoform X1 [Onthophagus taurus]|uniref:protein ECT2 isoform X1 n=1 Tax=Onthophagus taurus TaxID=166361 RepID=UPI0039BE386A
MPKKFRTHINMDEIGATVNKQSSIGSDSTGDDQNKLEHTSLPLDKRICLVGNVVKNTSICTTAQSFGVPVLTSENGLEYSKDQTCSTVFVVESFEGNDYEQLFKSRHPLLGPPALQQLLNRNEKLPNNTRPLYNLAMSGVVVCFTGFRNKDELTKLVPLVHHMGGSIRKEMSAKVTHLIANVAGGDKYQYAATFRVPIMHLNWVFSSWENRNDVNFTSTIDTFMAEHKLKPFYGAKVCFAGFPEEEEKHMTEVLEANGGCITVIDDPQCTHVVTEMESYPETTSAASITPIPSSTAIITPSETLNPTPMTTTPVLSSKITTPFAKLETLHEKSHDNEICVDLKASDSNSDLDKTSSSTRKRKMMSPDRGQSFIKRKRDTMTTSYSENAKKKISNFLKSHIFANNRRRTLDGTETSFNQEISFDEGASIASTSGFFEVETMEKTIGRISLTPSTSNSAQPKKARKNLFLRTFSSSKFKQPASAKKRDHKNVELENSVTDGSGGDKFLNNSCFPDLSFISVSEYDIRANCTSSRMMDQHHGNFIHCAVVDESTVGEKLEGPPKAHIVKAEWFWTSVQKGISLEEKDYLFGDYINQVLSPNTRRDSHQATPSSASRRKRKRLYETLSSLAQQQSPGLHNKRRSSIVSDAGLLSVSGSFLDCTASPDKPGDVGGEPAIPDTPRKGFTARQQVFLELVQTESNYVNILNIIMTMFKEQLENSTDEEALLNNTELKIIFGNLPPIYETHLKMLEELRRMSAYWTEDKSIGSIILKYSTDLLKAYPPFVNFFEEMKSMLVHCDQTKPRFHAFLKACQTKPECGRQSLQELLIRPVQRLPSISLLLNDILKNTPKNNADHAALEKALASIREVMKHINEDKRKTEGQRVMFDIFNEIDNCPPDLVSSHRNFVAKSEVIQLSSSEGLSSKGNPLVLFLFSDQLEVCKKRSKAFNTLKSPNTVNGVHKNSSIKPYKHVKLMSLSTIKRVIDIKETEDCQRVFSLVFRNTEELKERVCSFAMTDEESDKVAFLKTLCKQMATNACTADSEKFMAYLEPHQLDIDTSDINHGTLSRAFKFATKTRLRVGRAFSFNKTPSKLKRAVSSMMSPFGSSTNLTPASQLAQMRLASYNNISELGNAENASESPPQAPMSVQPTRKMKASSLGVNALKRL